MGVVLHDYFFLKRCINLLCIYDWSQFAGLIGYSVTHMKRVLRDASIYFAFMVQSVRRADGYSVTHMKRILRDVLIYFVFMVEVSL